eukprot:c18381_g1_i2.p1 GENE.c18381_g1_i2~~c18381_g1_i2.p1  ORF type:complete len:298 (+),score=124.12 c18381_g1_i2:41-934(+)
MFRSSFLIHKFTPHVTRVTVTQVIPKIATRSYQTAANTQALSQSQTIIRAAVGLGAAAGVFGLCYVGEKATDNVKEWDEYVAKRVKSTYGYLAGGLALTGLTAYSFYRTPSFIRFISSHPTAFSIGGLVLTIGSLMMTRSISQENMPAKLASWGTFNTIMGATFAPVCFMGGPVIVRAAIYTGVVVGSLSLVAMSAHSDKFLSWGQPLALGLGVILITSLGRIFLPAHLFLTHSIMDNIVIYGGTAVFSGLVLYDTQKIVAVAKRSPRFDPINESLGIYLDTINLFQLILNMQSRKK